MSGDTGSQPDSIARWEAPERPGRSPGLEVDEPLEPGVAVDEPPVLCECCVRCRGPTRDELADLASAAARLLGYARRLAD
jgi:hypothetical protein